MSTVRERVTQQFPSLFVTLVSVLIGLVLADVVNEAQARMTLWPLNPQTIFTWLQLIAIVSTSVTAWIVYSHIGISRHTVASLPDTLITFLTPAPLLIMTALTGRATSWPWFYGGGVYLLLSLITAIWQNLLALREPELASFRRLLRPSGYLVVLYGFAPVFLVLGWLDQAGYMPMWLRMAAVAGVVPASLICSHLFLRDWRIAVDEASTGAAG
jgi:hypothetical protein